MCLRLPNNSVTHGICAFLVLSYAKINVIAFTILKSTDISYMDKTLSNFKTVVYMQGTMSYFGNPVYNVYLDLHVDVSLVDDGVFSAVIWKIKLYCCNVMV